MRNAPSGMTVFTSKFVNKYHIKLEEENGVKKLCRYKTEELLHVENELKSNSNAYDILKQFDSSDIKDIIFEPIDPKKPYSFKANINGNDIIIFQTEFEKEVLRRIAKTSCELIKEFTLEEMPLSEIKLKRDLGVSGIVLKEDDTYYFSEISPKIHLSAELTNKIHMCSHGNIDCRRLSAATDKNGGCAKIREGSKYIERYPWITQGIETFNTRYDSFIVSNCLHHEKPKPRQKVSKEKLDDLAECLSTYFFK